MTKKPVKIKEIEFKMVSKTTGVARYKKKKLSVYLAKE